MTKTEFKSMHESGKLRLVQACYNKSLEDVITALEGVQDISCFTGQPVSRIDLKNQGDYLKVSCHTQAVQGRRFFFVVEDIDNALNRNCSWNDKITNTIVYVEA